MRVNYKVQNKQRAKVIAAIVKTLGTRLPSMDQKTFRKELEKSLELLKNWELIEIILDQAKKLGEYENK